MNKQLRASLAIVLFGLTFSTASQAWLEKGGERDIALKLKPDLENGVDVYEVCAACHLTEGWGTKEGTFPQLAGQLKGVLIKQLADIREGNRDNPTMYPFALPKEIKNAAPEVGGGPYAIAAVAQYIENIPMNPDPGVGPGTNLEHGEKLYKENCVRCHGKNGEGMKEKFFPLIQGQHYKYLVRQFEWIQQGKRRNANPEMVKQIAGFSKEDEHAVLDYVSRLKPPAEKVAKSADWLNPDYD